MEQQTTDALARRSAQRQAGFLLSLLERGASLLDYGCGPGSITCGLTRQVAPGAVVGIDADPAQIERAAARAASENLDNISFQVASIYDLPFAAGRFEVVFAHAIFQHLADPDRAIREMCRVLVPGGIIALRSPDWGALLIAPRTPTLAAALNGSLAPTTPTEMPSQAATVLASCGRPGARVSPPRLRLNTRTLPTLACSRPRSCWPLNTRLRPLVFAHGPVILMLYSRRYGEKLSRAVADKRVRQTNPTFGGHQRRL